MLNYLSSVSVFFSPFFFLRDSWDALISQCGFELQPSGTEDYSRDVRPLEEPVQ